MSIKWEKVTKSDLNIIHEIAKRAVDIAEKGGYKIDYMTMEMDITACHISNPLRLNELLSANNGDFGHDVFGIRKYIDRDTGKLKDCFSPRYSI